MKEHPPIIFVELLSRPAGFKEQEYLNLLKERLIENGFNEILKAVRSSIKRRLISWLYGSPSATITFRPFQVKDISLAFESGGLVAGLRNTIHKAVVYPDLNYSSALRDRVLSLNWYVAATMHELGHAIFGFKHTNQGIMQPKLIDPYLNFLPWQQEIIRKSIWGQ
jgi:hypothetical protein